MKALKMTETTSRSIVEPISISLHNLLHRIQSLPHYKPLQDIYLLQTGCDNRIMFFYNFLDQHQQKGGDKSCIFMAELITQTSPTYSS